MTKRVETACLFVCLFGTALDRVGTVQEPTIGITSTTYAHLLYIHIDRTVGRSGDVQPSPVMSRYTLSDPLTYIYLCLLTA